MKDKIFPAIYSVGGYPILYYCEDEGYCLDRNTVVEIPVKTDSENITVPYLENVGGVVEDGDHLKDIKSLLDANGIANSYFACHPHRGYQPTHFLVFKDKGTLAGIYIPDDGLFSLYKAQVRYLAPKSVMPLTSMRETVPC